MNTAQAKKLASIANNTATSAEAKLVQQALISAGLETPMHKGSSLSSDEKYQKIKHAFTEISEALGLDLTDDSLQETPHRIAKMYVQEIFSGLDYSNFPKITVIDNKMANDEMIMVKDINLTSTCEHHFVTIDGLAKVAYIPNKTIIGLSKINRLVRFFAQRPQVQERLTKQILIALKALLATEHVAVTINAVHYCVKARGVMDSNSSTTTTALSGCFKTNSASRAEFISN
ncbi:GTP cyclohydrolase I FolE [Thalassomonas sp. M1454]|uniref:GTP cyclohydrolase I FolE n=1 Tax=Thalassomonas sp. M1454 TaxID=2594477 RepID=UPI001180D44E|nr:GTP cyclohydrolase I FolE [Thalassomonas sp. M1454]TRX53855.1 GTP cyclohydrolase I FolE [Thalassomonas sp. M1454]